MELWIRSQDKEILMNCKAFKVGDYEDRYRIYGSCDGVGIEPLGDYVKGERALEIIDEIQKILKPKPIIKIDDIIYPEGLKTFEESIKRGETIVLNRGAIEHLDTYIYEMPEE